VMKYEYDSRIEFAKFLLKLAVRLIFFMFAAFWRHCIARANSMPRRPECKYSS